MERNSRIYVAGHLGLVGSALMRGLRAHGYTNLITRSLDELDLRQTADVREFFAAERPEYVLVAAAKVGGILANKTYPVEFLTENLRIQDNVITTAYECGVRKLLFLGSSCIYPKFAPQPIREDSFLDGKLEPTNEAYAIAKIAGITLCKSYRQEYGADFIAAMPTNLYGPNDNYNLDTSHVLPALIRKFHTAKVRGESTVTVWGTGTPRREFLHSDDLASACVYLMNHYSDEGIVNVGTGEDVSIADLAGIVKEVVGFLGDIVFDSTKPDGTPRKLLDVSRLHGVGWRHKIELPEGITSVYRDVNTSGWD
ncbi:MAG: GDP-L-fucose synthase family protein [Capsulimonadaceae bacterium]